MSKRILPLVLSLTITFLISLIGAQEASEADYEASYEAWLVDFEASLEYEQGSVSILDNEVALTIPDAFRFLGSEDARRVLTEAWGNPPGSRALGMIVPADSSPLDYDGWAVIVTFEEDGYVSDKDAAKVNYTKLLEQMQKDSAASNKQRLELGYETVELVGWAAEPSYDATSHKMYWAKELAFGEDPDHTLNYSVRILGRKGVLNLNAVASMTQLEQIQTDMQDVIEFAEFTEGSRYADFKKGEDKVAEYGLAGLVLGGAVVAKAGLFAKIGLILAKGGKFLIIAVIAVGGFLTRLFKR